MRTNAMKKCAVGAMLIGGTLGVATSASAGIFTPSDWSIVLPSSTPASASVTSSASDSIELHYDNTGNYDMWSGPLMTTFTIAAAQAGEYHWRYFGNHSLDHSHNLVVTINGVDTVAFSEVQGAPSFFRFGYITLTDGQSLSVSVGGSNSADSGPFPWVLYGTFTLEAFPRTETAVPAPGAIALLGAAGLVGTRRRRS